MRYISSMRNGQRVGRQFFILIGGVGFRTSSTPDVASERMSWGILLRRNWEILWLFRHFDDPYS